MMTIHAVQYFNDEVWKTIYITSYAPDATTTFEDLTEYSPATFRLVRFSVSNLDFLATQCRDFAVEALRQ